MKFIKKGKKENQNVIIHFQTNYDSLGQSGKKTTESFPKKQPAAKRQMADNLTKLD